MTVNLIQRRRHVSGWYYSLGGVQARTGTRYPVPRIRQIVYPVKQSVVMMGASMGATVSATLITTGEIEMLCPVQILVSAEWSSGPILMQAASQATVSAVLLGDVFGVVNMQAASQATVISYDTDQFGVVNMQAALDSRAWSSTGTESMARVSMPLTPITPVIMGAFSVGDDAHLWELWHKVDVGIRKRVCATSGGQYPRTAFAWSSGIIYYIDETTLVKEADDFPWTVNFPCSGDSRWVNYSCGPLNAHVPQFYDLILNSHPGQFDERKVIRTQITANDETSLTFNDISVERDVFKKISNLSSLNGKRFYIVPRTDNSTVGLWWHDRVTHWPSGEYDRGTATTTGAGYLIDAAKDFGNLSGDVVFQSSGIWKRKSITDNDSTRIDFSGTDVPDGLYFLVRSGDIFSPIQAGGGNSGPPFRWYGGAHTHYVSLFPNDDFGSGRHPRTQIPWYSGYTSCEEVFHDAYDVDVWSALDEQCSQADKCYSPDYYKSVRGKQVLIEGLTHLFVAQCDNYTGSAVIPRLTPATVFPYVNSNHDSDYDFVDYLGDLVFNFTVPAKVEDMHYTLMNERGEVVDFGIVPRATTLNFNVGYVYAGNRYKCNVSWGWRRKIERQIRYVYTREWYEPGRDINGNVLITPEDTPEGTGVWHTESPSTHYQEYDKYGFPMSGDAVANGHKARYVASNWHDSEFLGGSYENAPDDAEYIKHAEFQLPNDSASYYASRSGYVVNGGTDRQILTDKSWWTDGTLRTETGTATGGGTTTLTDSTKSASNFWNDTLRPWTDFILGVEVTPGVWEYRPIVAHYGTTLEVDEAFSASTSGKAYAIGEPWYVRNRWKGRKVKIHHENAIYTRVISHSDNNRLYWESPLAFTPTDADSWEIDELEPGEVLERSSGAWDRTSSGGYGSRFIMGDILERYGRARKADILLAPTVMELFAYLRRLTHTKRAFSWRPLHYDLTADNCLFTPPNCDTTCNVKQAGGIQYFGGSPPYSLTQEMWANLMAYVNSQWDGDCFYYNDGLPVAEATSFGNAASPVTGGPSSFGVNLYRQSAYSLIENIPTCLSSDCAFYVKAGIPPGFVQAALEDPVHNHWVFNSNGENVALNVFTRIAVDSGTTPVRKGGRFGSTNGGPPPVHTGYVLECDPGPPVVGCDTTSTTHYEGWTLLEWLTVLKWHMNDDF